MSPTASLTRASVAAASQELRGPPEGSPLICALARPSLGVGELRNNAELLHHPERVPVRVLLDDLAVRKAGEGEPRDRHLLAGGSDAHQVTVVRAATCPAARDLVAFGDLLVDPDPGIRVCGAISRDVFLETVGAAQWLWDGRVVTDVVAVDELVDDAQVPLPRFLEETADDRFVLIRGHKRSFPRLWCPRGGAAPRGWDRSRSEESFGT